MRINSGLPAFFTAAFGLDGKVIIQQIQRQDVLEHDDGMLEQLKLHPIELLHVADPTPQDQAGNLTAALGDVAGAMALTISKHEATIADLTAERDRLRIVVDAFPSENPGPGSAAEPSLEP